MPNSEIFFLKSGELRKKEKELGEKQYACTECDKEFNNSYHLNKNGLCPVFLSCKIKLQLFLMVILLWD